MGIRALAIVVLLAGCSTAVNLPAGQTALCAPPGLPDPATWRLHESKPVVLMTTDHRLLVGVEAWSTAEGHVLRSLWVDGLLAFVDPAPDDMKAAMWIDPQIMTEEGVQSPHWQSCEWQEYRLKERT